MKKIYIIFGLLLVLALSAVVYFGLIRKLVGGEKSKQPSRTVQVSAVEVESGQVAGSVTVGTDSNAAGGKYIQLGTALPPSVSPTPKPVASGSFQPSAPYYATFYYPWYKNAATDGSYSYWQDGGHAPPKNWSSNYLPDVNSSVFQPSSELYSSNDDVTLYWQLRKMAEAKQEVAISSWWGQGHKTDASFKHVIGDVMNRSDNPYPNLRWAIFYEQEGFNDYPALQIASDLAYIKTNYASQSAYFKVDGKPVIFVYGGETDGAEMAKRWRQANANGDFYVVLKVFSGYQNDPSQPNSWFQYAPAKRSDSQGAYSFMVSPGFWKEGDAVRLGRDLAAFRDAVSAMKNSTAVWRLTETWNEWGEGTAVEPGDQVVQSKTNAATLDPAGVPFKNAYIDILNQILPALENGTGSKATGGGIIAGVTTDPVIAAAGDIACGSNSSAACKQKETADLIAAIKPTAVLAVGDTQYENGELANYQAYYDPTWGRFKSITKPAVGNHEYNTAGAEGYYVYFGSLAGDPKKGYYSYSLGSWHLVVLNSNCSKVGGCGLGSPQEKWLRTDLAANPSACTLAYFHHPRFSSGQHGSNAAYGAFWQALYDYKADVVLAGHDHMYERFGPQDANGKADAGGIREFVVGMGGRNHTGFAEIQPNSQARNSDTFGVLKMVLHQDSYDWEFVPEAGKTFRDSGSSVCVKTALVTGDTNAPSAPGNLTAKAQAGQIDLSWSAGADNIGVTGYKIFRNGAEVGTTSGLVYSDKNYSQGNTYNYQVAAFDAAGNTSAKSGEATMATSCVSLPSDAPNVTLTPNIDQTNNYVIWTRMMSGGDNANSYYLQVDGNCPVIVGDSVDMAQDMWSWVNYKDGNRAKLLVYKLEKGSHTVKLIGREGGVKIDKLIFTTDAGCVPSAGGDKCLSDSAAPTVTIISPQPNETVSGEFDIVVNSSDDKGVLQVEYSIDDVLKGTVQTAPYSYPWMTTELANGVHTIAVRAYDEAGNVGSASVKVNVANADL